VIHIEDVLLWAVAQAGDRYVFGAAIEFNNDDPNQFDCSGLVAWACNHAGVRPNLPHASWLQAKQCHDAKTDIAIDDAIATRGALLFGFTEGVDPFTATARPDHAHVAISLGNDRTIEAASQKWGVGTFSADKSKRKWTHAALIPNVDYTNRPPPKDPDQEEEVANQLIYYAGSDGAAHPYLVNGVTAKHLSPDGLNLAMFLGHKPQGDNSVDRPLTGGFLDCVAFLDGPLKNINL
jgi:hypothetical protein